MVEDFSIQFSRFPLYLHKSDWQKFLGHSVYLYLYTHVVQSAAKEEQVRERHL